MINHAATKTSALGSPELSVVVPMHNERDNLALLCERLSKALSTAEIQFELLFVDDGSTDDSVAVARALSMEYPWVRVLCLVRNFGKEAAMLAGYDHVQGCAVVVLDADLQQPPELLVNLVDFWRKGYDIINAVRVDTEGISWTRKLASSLFYKINLWMTGVKFPAQSADFGLLDVSVVEALCACREVHRFNRALVAWTGFRSTEISYKAAPRNAGQTQWTRRKLFKYALDGILSFSVRPLRLVGLAGVALSVLSFSYLLLVAFLRIYHPELAGVGSGYASIIGMICLLGGFQLTSIWLLGEYIGRIYEQVKGRPSYLLRDLGPLCSQPSVCQNDRTILGENHYRLDAAHPVPAPQRTRSSRPRGGRNQIVDSYVPRDALPGDSIFPRG